MINLDWIQTFLLAAECLSFSETARHLHVTQPTVSHHIAQLEADLGVLLFNRSGHRLQLTEAGRLLLPMARQLVRQAMDVRDMMASCREEVAGHLRIACSTTAGKYILPLLAARFRRRHPGIQVTILACRHEQLVERLQEREANLSITSSEIVGSGLQSQPFFEDNVILIVPAGHPWSRRDAVEPEELAREPMLILDPMSGTRRVLLTELARHDITFDDLNILLEIGNAEAIVNTVQAGFGIACVSVLAATTALELGRVTAVPLNGMQMRRTIYMVRQELSPPQRAQEVFWRFVHDASNADLLQLPDSG